MNGVSLAERFREKVKTVKDYRMKFEAEQDVMYPTGFLGFDYLNGTTVHVKSDTMDFTYNSIGIIDGSMVSVIGRTGCGKTTFILQAAAEIIRPYSTACIYHDDVEGGIVQSRKEILTHMHGEEFAKRYISRNAGVTAENFFERVKIIHDLKMEDRESFEYDTGLFDYKGERIFKLEPTVYILDSIAMLMPEKYLEEEELSGQMSATAAAKTNSSVFKRIIPMLKAANIILFVVNHITEDVSINPMQRKKPQAPYLKMGETLGGGRLVNYVTNLVIRLDDNTKLKETEGYGIRGSIVEFTIGKSRTCPMGRSINMIFNFACGFDRELSLLQFMKEYGYVITKGAYLKLKDHDEIKMFTHKTFKERLNEDEEFQKAFIETAMVALEGLINKPGNYFYDEEVQEEENKFDITAALMSNINQQLAKVA